LEKPFYGPKEDSDHYEIEKTEVSSRCFIGFANFYRFFIQDYSKIAAPLTHIIYKDKLEWSLEAD
jgi:hypothetical protein